MISQQQCQNARILIVDDQMTNLMLLESILQNAGYKNIHTTQDPTQVVNLYKELSPDLICLDIRMPQLNGFQVMGQLKIIQKEGFLPILVLTSEEDRETRLRALESGAKDFLNKPFDKIEVLMRIRNLLEASLLNKAVSQQKDILEETVRIRTQELQETQLDVVHRLARAAEYRDNETGAHIVRMSHFAVILGRACGMSEQECDVLFHATPMHDVGKLGIPDRILLKPGKLDPEEFETMKQHTVIGAQLLANSQSPVLRMGEIIALTHHEKWDGSGYPNRLSGEDIPLPGRICALADVFDALSSKRCYKDAWPLEKTLAEIRSSSGKHFDPRLVEIFEELLPVILNVQQTHSDMETPKFELTEANYLA
ncbi:MAG: response regulator [Nitrospira sp.]|nr:response regulator [Nitrospira sp.]MCA9476924.1 response regulator [Nitrospira sp.]MCB9710191.1 response regulator [Nitrospiraceae bacterium]MDR4488320.1 response regulator [Nitrospirales bacterium]MDR4489236.1 response regulator [Nitrospirales bacterium]